MDRHTDVKYQVSLQAKDFLTGCWEATDVPRRTSPFHVCQTPFPFTSQLSASPRGERKQACCIDLQEQIPKQRKS